MTINKKMSNDALDVNNYQAIMEGYQPKVSNERLAINGYQPQNNGSVGFFSSPITMQQCPSSLESEKRDGYQPPSQTRPVAPPPKKP
ncbi:hypothetical protein ACUT11_004136 [Escherichia coli]|uniref:hypothetical protein n=1 Tax=Escherichia coli TaxID=562 RepID=UPI0010CBB95D|nr:hypothetical protein [Escherichia coli]MBB9655245.1 hypothetical protein [Escherichia coli]MDY8721950.1 hypothetical protein [Escherichia coli]MDY8790942.1 hypothetical protein [Escherichia coli]MDY8869718.1 hypothetical protein [Escherichia coli]MDY8906399.1 hypothetical protein [Escherichia coli]